jgi:hypothetical protein
VHVHVPHEEGSRSENCSSSSSASGPAGVGVAQATQIWATAGKGKGSFLFPGSLPDGVPWLSKGVDSVDCTDVSLGWVVLEQREHHNEHQI